MKRKIDPVPVLVMALMTAVMAWALYHHFTLPTVYYSWTTKECVKVVGCDCDCTNPPDRAETVWVR